MVAIWQSRSREVITYVPSSSSSPKAPTMSSKCDIEDPAPKCDKWCALPSNPARRTERLPVGALPTTRLHPPRLPRRHLAPLNARLISTTTVIDEINGKLYEAPCQPLRASFTVFLLAKESTGLEELNDSSRVSVKSRGAQCGRTWLEIDSRVTSDDEKCRDALLEPGSCLEGRLWLKSNPPRSG